MTRARPYALLAAAAALPRASVLLYERDDILVAFTEKSDDFARTFVASGTYGFVPGVPSAYTQPLYGFFLIPLYEVFGRTWVTVGVAQIALAALTAILVYEIGRRYLSPAAGLLAALIATLSPYLVWHDVHVNREIVDQPLAAALVLLALVTVERRSVGLAALLGVVCGLAILGNTRLALLPVLLGAYVAWRLGRDRRALAAAAVVVAGAALAVAPWVVRNGIVVGCYTLTTDARALWKANNEQTDEVLARGGWIDDVEAIPGRELTPEFTRDIYRSRGEIVRVDECDDMRFFRAEVLEFWREQPGEKGALAVRGVGMLWDPRATRAEGQPGEGTALDFARTWVVAVYVLALYALALPGLLAVPRAFAALALLLLAYGTLAAAAFVGATRYRAPWDFVLALLAAAGALWVVRRMRRREA